MLSPPFPPMPHMQALIAQAGGIDLFNQLAATVLSQPSEIGLHKIGTVFNTNAEFEQWLAPEDATLQEFFHAPAESVDCINEALLRRPYRWVSNPAAVGPSRIRLYRNPDSPDDWISPPNNMDYFWAHGGVDFEYRFRFLFRSIHGRNLGPLTLTPAARAAWNQEKAARWPELHAIQLQAIAAAMHANGGMCETKEDD